MYSVELFVLDKRLDHITSYSVLLGILPEKYYERECCCSVV